MTDYDFIDPDLPEKRDEDNDEFPEIRNRAVVTAPTDPDEGVDIVTDEATPMDIEEAYPDVCSDKGAEEDSRGFLGRAINRLKNTF